MKNYRVPFIGNRSSVILAIGGLALVAQVQAQPFPPVVVEKAVPAQQSRLLSSGITVKAPPRPAGSESVVLETGLNPQEVTRQKRAHNDSRLGKKDPTRDDTLDVLPVVVKSPVVTTKTK